MLSLTLGLEELLSRGQKRIICYIYIYMVFFSLGRKKCKHVCSVKVKIQWGERERKEIIYEVGQIQGKGLLSYFFLIREKDRCFFKPIGGGGNT